MKFVGILVELFTLGYDIFQSFVVISVRLGIKSYFTSDLKLIQYITLADLIGVELKTERRDTDLLKSLVNNIERSLFLSSEKNLLVVRKTVSDYRCNCL